MSVAGTQLLDLDREEAEALGAAFFSGALQHADARRYPGGCLRAVTPLDRGCFSPAFLLRRKHRCFFQ